MGKKILCVIDTFKIGGGAQTQLAGLAVMLKQNHYDVTALSYHEVSPEQSCEPYLTQQGIDYICMKGANNMWQKFNGLRKIIKELHPDTIIAYLTGPATICSLLKMLGGNFNLIVSERNVTQNLTCKEFIKFQLYRFADKIIPNAYSQETYIKQHFPFLANKVETISNFVDTDKFIYDSTIVNQTQEHLEILVAARVNPQKNILRFIEALDILKDRGLKFHVSWYGQKTVKYYEQCIAKIGQLDLTNNITFYDATKEIAKVYADPQYDVFCLPSLFEGCPNTIGEAMSSGLPVLCSNVCDNAIYVKDGINGFYFDPLNSNDIAEAIIKFANTSQDTRIAMRKQSRQRAIALLSKDSFIKKYINII